MSSVPPYDLRAALRGFANGWNRFFYAPADLRVSALMRIGFALAVLINLACWYPDLDRWFSDSGVLTASELYLVQPLERWTILSWFTDSTSVHVIFWVATLQTMLLLLGAGSRINSVCVLVWLLSFQHRNPIILDMQDTLLHLLGWYVALMPTGRVWSLDAYWRGKSLVGETAPAPGLRLLQIQMTIIFLTAAWFKLLGDPWRNGTALFYVGQLDDYFGRTPALDWAFVNPTLVRLMTWSVLVIEIIVPIGMWFRQTRRWAFLLAVLFHVGNELTMHLFLFHSLMILGWCSFLTPEDFELLRKWTTPRRHGATEKAKSKVEPQMNADAR